MNKRKNYGKKIKRTKNLYRKKASAGKKAFGTAAFVLGVSALAFLGFCIGKPLFDYLGDPDRNKQPEWTPEASYSQQQEETMALSAEEEKQEAVTKEPAADDKKEETSSAPETQPEPEEIPDDITVSFEAPASALANRASLSAVVSKAKSSGYNSVVLRLKDAQGYFNYKTEIENVKDTRLVNGSMSLPEIVSVFKEIGMRPIGEISVLSDHAGCELFSAINFKCIGLGDVSWLDYTSGMPTRWANPDSVATIEYFGSIAAELVSAGIEDLVLSNVIFPNFQNYDKAYIDKKYFAADRYKMLYNVVKAGNIIEINASDVLAEKFGRTAELLYDTSMMHDNSIALVINRDNFPVDGGYPADAVVLTETVISEAKNKAGDVPIIPVIESTSFGDTDTGRIVGALSNMGYPSFIMR